MTHFYTQTQHGIETRHTVPMVKDPSKKRASSTADAKKAKERGELWYPSVTSAMDVLAKHTLIDWKITKHLETAYITPINDRDRAQWMKKVRGETALEMDKAPQAGTDIHIMLERFMRGEEIEDIDNNVLICNNVKTALLDYCGEQDWEIEKSFIDEVEGYAGSADLVSPCWMIDYKTKQTAKQFKLKTERMKSHPMVYNTHFMQLAAYSMAIHCGLESCANIFICIETGEVDFVMHSGNDIAKGWEDFSNCLDIYHRNNYSPFNGRK